MQEQSITGSAKMSTAGGILISILANITPAGILNTIVMAAIGAVVSFLVSMALKYCISRWFRSK